MKRIILTFIVLTTMNLSFAQDADSTVTEPSKWKLQATYGLNGTQSSFVNWAAGGRNNISVLGYIEASAKYSKNILCFERRGKNPENNEYSLAK